MFIIQEGKIEIRKPKGAETLKPTLLGPGDFFGELSLFEDQRRDTTAKGVTQYRLLRIDRTTLDQLVQENPEIAVRMLYRLASRLREHEEALRRASEIAAGAMNPIRPSQSMASGVIAPPAAVSIRLVALTGACAAPTPAAAGARPRQRHADRRHRRIHAAKKPMPPTQPIANGPARLTRRHRRRVRVARHERRRSLRSGDGIHAGSGFVHARHQANAQPPPCVDHPRRRRMACERAEADRERNVRQRRARRRGREDQAVGRRSVAFWFGGNGLQRGLTERGPTPRGSRLRILE